jgi:hypothetical protein
MFRELALLLSSGGNIILVPHLQKNVNEAMVAPMVVSGAESAGAHGMEAKPASTKIMLQ